MTRLWPNGEAITVQADLQGHPECFMWRGQLHPVQGIANHWRVDEGWWVRRVWREYFTVYTLTGLLVAVYHDLLADQWYLQRLYD